MALQVNPYQASSLYSYWVGIELKQPGQTLIQYCRSGCSAEFIEMRVGMLPNSV